MWPGVRNASWLLGADTGIPALAALLGSRRVACDHGTSIAQMNLNQRKRSMPYDRKVAVDLPVA